MRADSALPDSPPPESGSRPTAPPLWPLSINQEWIWRLQRAHPESTLFHLPAAVRIRGLLREARLERALSRLLARHAALRTTFAATEQAAIVHESAGLTVPIVPTELEPGAAGAALAKLEYQLVEEIRRPFDLLTGPPLRARLFVIDAADHILLLTFHRVAADEWSVALLLRELEELYHAFTTRATAVLPELTIQYTDVAAWQRRWLASEHGAQVLAYWTRRLRGLAPTRLPMSGSRWDERSTRSAQVQRVMPPSTRDRLVRLVRQAGTTIEIGLLAALTHLLAAETGQDEVAVGVRVPCRIGDGMAWLVGNFANTLVIRTELGGNPSFRESLHRLHDAMIEALRHQVVPYPSVLAALHPNQPPRLDPWCPVTFALTPAPAAPPATDEVTFEPIAAPVEETPAELSVVVAEQADGPLVTFVYAADLFAADAMAALLDRFLALLERVVADPEQPVHPPVGTGATRQIGLAPPPRPAVVSPRPALVPLLAGDSPGRRPVYLVPGGSGSANMLVAMAGQMRQWSLDRPVYGFLATEPVAADDGHAWVETTAAAYAREMRDCQPDGPYLLLGSCVGGILAVATAHALAAAGLDPPHIILIDTRHPALGLLPPAQVWRDLTVPLPGRRRRALQVGAVDVPPAGTGEASDPADDPEHYFERVLYGPHLMRLKQHRPRPYSGEVTLLANQVWLDQSPALGWAPPAVARLHVHVLPGDHEGHMQDNAELIGRNLRPLLDGIEGAAGVFTRNGGDAGAPPPER